MILKLAQDQHNWQLCCMPKGLHFPLTIIYRLLDVCKEVVYPVLYKMVLYDTKNCTQEASLKICWVISISAVNLAQL